MIIETAVRKFLVRRAQAGAPVRAWGPRLSTSPCTSRSPPESVALATEMKNAGNWAIAQVPHVADVRCLLALLAQDTLFSCRLIDRIHPVGALLRKGAPHAVRHSGLPSVLRTIDGRSRRLRCPRPESPPPPPIVAVKRTATSLGVAPGAATAQPGRRWPRYVDGQPRNDLDHLNRAVGIIVVGRHWSRSGI